MANEKANAKKRRLRRNAKKAKQLNGKNYIYSPCTVKKLHKINKTKEFCYKKEENETKKESKTENYKNLINKGIAFMRQVEGENENEINDEEYFKKEKFLTISTINLHKSVIPTLEMRKIVDEISDLAIICAQEPPLKENLIDPDSMPLEYCVAFGERPRACIYHNRKNKLIG